MSISSADCGPVIRRSPRGERGLKFERVKSAGYTPVRRSPRGERGLKWNISFCILCKCRSRSPRGERGLKSLVRLEVTQHLLSLSSRRAWIEI